MQEYLGSALNITFVVRNDGALGALAEIIVITSEPTYSVDAAGGMIRRREVSQLRFGASLPTLRRMIENFTEYADEMEAAQAKFARVPDEDEPDLSAKEKGST